MRRRPWRRQLALPSSLRSPPPPRRVRFDSSVRTAGELMAGTGRPARQPTDPRAA